MTIPLLPVGRTETDRTNHCLTPTPYIAGASGLTASAGASVTSDSSVGSPAVASHAPGAFKVATSGTNPYVYFAAQPSAAPGDRWTLSLYWLTGTIANTYVAEIAAFDAGGSSTGSWSVALPSSTSWTRFSVTTPALPANTTHLVIYPVSATGSAAESVWFSAVLLEKSATLGSWFDGYSDPNSWWTGAVGNSQSMLRTLSPALPQNPNWPVLDVRAWTDEDPFTLNTGPNTAPSMLSDRVTALSIERGRQYELDEDQTGTCKFSADNRDGALTAGTNGTLPMRVCAAWAWWEGAKYPLFTGYVERWPTQSTDPSMGVSSIECVDLFEPLSTQEMMTNYDEQVLVGSDVPPTLYYPLSDSQGSPYAGNKGAGTVPYPPAPLVNFKYGATDNTPGFGANSILINDGDSMFQYANASGAVNRGTQIQVCGPENPYGPTIDFSQPWYVELWFQCTAGKTILFSALTDDGKSTIAYIEVDYTSSNIACVVGSNPIVNLSVAQIDLSHNNYIGFGYDGTNFVVDLWGGNQHTSAYVVPAVSTSRWIALGQSFNHSLIFLSSNADITYGRVGITLGSAPTSRDKSNRWGMGKWGWSNEYPYSRINRAMEWGGHQAYIVGDQVTTALSAMPDSKGSSALDIVRTATLDALGRVFVRTDGLVEFQERNHTQALTPSVTFGSDTAAGEVPYTGTPAFDFDPTHIYNDAQVTQTSGVVARWTDAASMARYFQRVIQVNANVESADDALYAAEYLVSRYKDPQLRVQQITVDPGSNPALWPKVLPLELGDLVQLNHRMIGAPTVSMLCEVQKIVHNVTDGQSWTVDIQLAPVITRYWLLGAMHTTVKTAVASGVTSIDLNPLPDSATNPAEASLGAGTTITLEPGTANAETMTIASVVSNPTPGTAGYTSLTVTFTAATAHAHAKNAVVCDPLPSGVTDPTVWDARSVLGTNTIVSY